MPRAGICIIDMLKKEMEASVEVANVTWMTVVPGPYDLRLEWDYQTANVVECLKHMAGSPGSPTSWRWCLSPSTPSAIIPACFFPRFPRGSICKAVRSLEITNRSQKETSFPTSILPTAK